MQTDATDSQSIITDWNSLGHNHVMAGFHVPLSTLGEAMNNFASNGVTVANSDQLWNVQQPQPRRDALRDFSTGTSSYPQMNYNSRDFMEGIPVLDNTLSIENQVKLANNSGPPFAYPVEYPKTAIAAPNVAVNCSFDTAMNFEGLVPPFDTNTRWDFNNFMAPPKEWIMNEPGVLNSNSPGSSRFSNELSLSLATSQCSEMSSSGLTSYSLHKRHSDHNASCSSSSNLSLSFDSHKPLPLSPFLSGSRFFQAMQEILAEIACYALQNFDQMSYSTTGIDNGVNVSSVGLQNNLVQERETEAKKKHLLALLQGVDDRYNQCLDEIHTVISAFHAVTELDPNLHARFALPTISFMYKSLRERISSHILAMGPHFNEGEERGDKSFESSFIQKQWALQQLRKRDQQLWRPQRGLPERSVSVLRAWMFQNFLHPYPKDAEKHLLALKSGLSRSQVSNWFINARVRLWKPMIEEMYAEMNRRKALQNNEETDGTQRNCMRFENRRFTMD
ncbi:hypothetical protein RD792_001717 [Penstemon davidsonii]|uniref:Homeobox domain-containing protein n=1 Tax=Penstemon davidsonii TaxID=160366 RepID=A0ABR0DP54_9LAMI|nr:hypothetical protein RD792_001717 [Penstemon davidsonii]